MRVPMGQTSVPLLVGILKNECWVTILTFLIVNSTSVDAGNSTAVVDTGNSTAVASGSADSSSGELKLLS